MNIQCRPIIKSDDIEALVDLHGLIWVTDDRDAIPSHVLLALQHAGSLLLGAFDDNRIIGFSLAFPGYINEQRFLWSHVTGVLPDYQGRGIGKQLKLLQRKLALARGYDQIRWTYDPLQAGNANFNISQLGCRCNSYHEDFYGQANDGLNAGLPTDRFEVVWLLARPSAKQPELEKRLGAMAVAIEVREGAVVIKPLTLQEPEILVPIHADINALRSENLAKAVEWRLATRAVFLAAFAAGYEVTGFVRQMPRPGYGAYILRPAT